MFDFMKNNNINIKNLTILIIVAVVMGFTYNFFRADSLSLIREEVELEQAEDIGDGNESGFESENNFSPQLINIDQVYALFKQNAATFVDARDNWEFGEGHIINAVNIPEYKFEPSDTSKLPGSKDDILVIYCGGTDCDVSKRLAVELSELGYQRLFVFEEGWDEWEKAGYPTSSGKKE